MQEMSKAHQEHLKELLESVSVSRDDLPYTKEFQRLKGEFYDRTFRTLTDAEFWNALVTVAKKGGVRGKKGSEPPPALDTDQKAKLQEMFPGPIGERDRLPYTERFSKFVLRFNEATGLNLSERGVWLAVLNIAK
jgi:hypothetical protein